jgi:hypothetical protein
MCSSSLHQFAPFRPDFIAWWSQVPPVLTFIKVNLFLTGISLALIVIMALLYFRGYRNSAATGLVILACVMLIPNDDCPNEFNRPWMGWLGASPLMFLGNSVVLLIGYCGLNGVRPRVSCVVMGLINTGVLLLGLGHLTALVW